MSYELRRVPLAPEMYAFEAEIRRNQGLVAGRNAKHRTVIADTFYNRASLTSNCRSLARESPNLRNQFFFR